MILFQSQDVGATIKQFNDGYRTLSAEGLPSALGTYQAVINSPMGISFGVLFLWSSDDLSTGEQWLQKISSLAPVAMSTVAPTTVTDWLRSGGEMIGGRCYGSIMGVSVNKLTPQTVDVLSDFAKRLPADPSTIFGVHEVRSGPSIPPAASSILDSVFPQRFPHFLIEIVPTVRDPEKLAAAQEWATQFRDALLKADDASTNLLTRVYPPFNPPDKLDPKEWYDEEEYAALQNLKKVYDPENIFRSSVIKL